ncbi:hypothetical protein BSL78_02205 [Apostichopus japonicus]|uniref:Ig-like domain-containing protein n=1 Tax=Stichopus japonicus TaxID=307972 RepID=A0A2G8LKV6_STIJA|nr:hypothetical protein BSL78_02205 [Apostichopus japonicus]
MAPWERTMSTVMLLILGSISTNVNANITKTPSSGLFLEGNDVTLSCVVQDNDHVIWEEDATSIFVGKEKYTEKKKYDNFEISSGDEDFSLTIKDVHLSDEGTYVCKDKDRLANATVTVGDLPICNIIIAGNEVRCTCQANPPVDKYRMELNGNLQDGDILYLEDSSSANVTCFGTNEMGTGRSSILFPGNKAGFGILSIVVTISVGVVLMVLAAIYIKRRFSSRGKKSDEEQPNKEETNELLPTPGAISHEEKLPEDMKDIFKEFQQYKVEVSAIISSEWDLFAIDALGLEVTEVLEIINRKPPIKGNFHLFLSSSISFATEKNSAFTH